MNKNNNNIILIGFMGSGKSSVSKELAKRLGREVCSTDEMVESKEGRSIVDIFEKSGEVYFREVEKSIVKSVSNEVDKIIDCGGGVITDSENFRLLKEGGTIFFLNASPGFLYDQIKLNSDRPLMKTDDPLGKIKEMLISRMPMYMQADYIVSSEDRSINEITDEIMGLI